jgi:hypothetical protein
MPNGKRAQSSQSFFGLIKIRSGTSVPETVPYLGVKLTPPGAIFTRRRACGLTDEETLSLYI